MALYHLARMRASPVYQQETNVSRMAELAWHYQLAGTGRLSTV